MERKCKHCNKLFEAKNSGHGYGLAQYCSIRCANLNRPKKQHKPNVTCAQCNKPFYRQPSHLKNSKSGLFFCSRACKDQGQRLEEGHPEIHPPHYGTAIHVYRQIAFREHPNECNICGFKEFPGVLEVHHKDSNRENNNKENLVILCPTCHHSIHFIDQTGRYGRSR